MLAGSAPCNTQIGWFTLLPYHASQVRGIVPALMTAEEIPHEVPDAFHQLRGGDIVRIRRLSCGDWTKSSSGMAQKIIMTRLFGACKRQWHTCEIMKQEPQTTGVATAGGDRGSGTEINRAAVAETVDHGIYAPGYVSGPTAKVPPTSTTIPTTIPTTTSR